MLKKKLVLIFCVGTFIYISTNNPEERDRKNMQLLDYQDLLAGLDPLDRQLCKIIIEKLKSTDPEDRYMALYFLSNFDVSDLSEFLLLQVIDDHDPVVQSQIMWLLIKCIESGRLIDTAFDCMMRQCNSQNDTLRMWAFELKKALVKNNHTLHVESMLDVLNENHELVQIQKMLFEYEIYHVQLDRDKYLLLVGNFLKSSDENVRYTAIYLLQYLIDFPETHDYVAQILLQQQFSTPRMWQQALWMLSLYNIKHNILADQIENIGWQSLQHEHWRVRFAAALLLKSIFLHKQDSEKQINRLRLALISDKNEWVKMLEFCRK